MLRLFMCFLAGLLLNTTGWHYNLEEAKEIAHKEHKHILLNFSGSDWCGPCIMMRKEILDDPAFLKMADTALVLVNADFPRKKKDQLSTRQQSINNALADQYNSEGKFPLTLLLNADGKVLQSWDGYPGVKPEVFAGQVEQIIESDK
jgi:thioredoxin-related protein